MFSLKVGGQDVTVFLEHPQIGPQYARFFFRRIDEKWIFTGAHVVLFDVIALVSAIFVCSCVHNILFVLICHH